MKRIAALTLLAALSITPALAGDPVAGKQKATACIACHGGESFGGLFYTLQLGGRDADKLAIKTNKYKTGKILHPVMNMATALFTEKEIEDISAYYQSLGKPAVTSPLFTIKGDDAPETVAAK
jgi:cytochrome c553